MTKPVISAVLPVYNERAYISSSLSSILKQKQETFNLEILIADGGSNDGTLDIIKEFESNHQNIRLYNNPDRTTPYAMNIGIRHASGEFIAILGTHTIYSPDYLQTCLDELLTHEADGCSGKVNTIYNTDSLESTLVYHVLNSPFGVSNKSYRTIQEGFGEHCPFPLFRRTVFEKVGLYNENLTRNQDNDMNHRILKAGMRLYYTFKTSAEIYPRSSISALLRYAYKSGIGNAISLKISPGSMSLRHIIPAGFTFSIISSFILAILFSLFQMSSLSGFFLVIGLLIISLHLVAGFIFALVDLVKHKKIILFVLPLMFICFHFMYGLGTITGLLKKAK